MSQPIRRAANSAAAVSAKRSGTDARSLRSSPEVLECRMRERGERGERHPVHFDAMELPRLREDIASGLFDALALDVPLIRVTVEGYDPPFEEIGVALRPVSNG